VHMFSDRWADLLQGQLADIPRRRRALLLFMAVSLTGGVLAARGSASQVVSVAAGGLVGLAMLSAVWFLVDMLRDLRARPERPATTSFLTVRPIGGRYVIGVSIERGRVIYGAVELAGDASAPVGNIRVHQLGKPRSRAWSKPLEAYSQTAGAIAELLNESGDRKIDGIGIALPGLVDVARSELQNCPAGIAPGHVPLEISKALAAADMNALRRFGLEIDVDALTRNVARVIAIDNDSRCIGRFLLNAHPQVRNFVSIYVGKGIGSTIVLEGNIYFGSHGFAGECGHQILGLDRRVAIPLTDRVVSDLETPACGCHRAGAHYEPLINDTGLLRLARHLDPELYDRLAPRLTTGHDIEGSSLIECAAEVLLSEESTAATQVVLAAAQGDHGRVMHFFESLQDTYIQFLTMGIANVVNMLDLDNTYLSGPLIEGFDKLPGFRDELQRSLKKYLFRDDRVNIRIDGAVAGNVWIGAALLFRDSAYANAARLPPAQGTGPVLDLSDAAMAAGR
jgi:predicted NBD/HSP70 family sugar kinase